MPSKSGVGEYSVIGGKIGSEFACASGDCRDTTISETLKAGEVRQCPRKGEREVGKTGLGSRNLGKAHSSGASSSSREVWGPGKGSRWYRRQRGNGNIGLLRS